MRIFNSTSNALILVSGLTLLVLFFINLATQDGHGVIAFIGDTSFLTLIVGYILRQKNIQQLGGLFLYIIVYNFDIYKGTLFQLVPNDFMFQVARHYTFFIIVPSMILLLPTLSDKYKFRPLTNSVKLTDSTIILTVLILTIIMQTVPRLV